MINNILGKGKKNSIKGASLKMQFQWQKMSPKMKNINRMMFKDTDKDGVPDKWDCQPLNKFRQDTRILLSKRKDKNKHTFYTHNPTERQKRKNTKNIFIGSGYKNIDFNKEKNINNLSKTIDHEELHYLLDKEISNEASAKLDNITRPSYIYFKNPQEDVLLDIDKQKEIISNKEKIQETKYLDKIMKLNFRKGSLENQKEWQNMNSEERDFARKIKRDIYEQ